ncbi:unnamed protein product [Echinostoma caproni]|uniref:DUF3719 domain-containing protein n=1 Tax=Echinostoma caproni TaxID=27848 RepID=A0A183AHH7_9TREM|nr:unnamed protein product [Echinostoma caproni]
MCIARRVPRPDIKKVSTSSPDLVSPDVVPKSDKDRKSTNRFHDDDEEVSVNSIKNHVFLGNGYIPETARARPVHSSRTRVVAAPLSKSDSPAVSRFRVQNGLMRPSPSPVNVRTDIPLGKLRKNNNVLREARSTNSVDRRQTTRNTHANTQVGAIKEFEPVPAESHCPIPDEKADLTTTKHSYTPECAVSAWLLQCNNASVILDENDGDADGVVVVKEMAEDDSGILVPDSTDLEVKPTEPILSGDPLSMESSNQWNALFSRPVPNKLAHSGNFEFDRQQSERVREMFEEIDRMLFDATGTKSPTPSIHPSGRKPRHADRWNVTAVIFTNFISSCEFKPCLFDAFIQFKYLTYYTEGSHNVKYPTNFESSSNEFNFDLSHLKGECLDWLSRFPHLRICGEQIVPTRDSGFQFYTSPHERIKGDANTLSSKCVSPTESKTPRATDNGEAEKGEVFTPKNSSLVSRLNTCNLQDPGQEEEEIFAIHGEYEEVIAIDMDTVSHPSAKDVRKPQHRRTKRTARTDPDPVDSPMASIALPNRKTQLPLKLVQLLNKEINRDLIGWLRTLILADKSAARTNDLMATLNTPISNPNWSSHFSRLSPQSTLYPMAVVTSRPLSGVHSKIVPNSSRKSIPSTLQTNNDSIAGFNSSTPSVVGVAAGFHPIGRLAPLDRVRTPSGSRTTSHADENIVPGLDMTSHSSIHWNKNPFGSSVHTTVPTQTYPSQHATVLTAPQQSTFGSSNATSIPVDHMPSRGSCTLPPLGTGSVTLGMAHGSTGSSVPNVPSLPNPSKGSAISTRLGPVSVQSIPHAPPPPPSQSASTSQQVFTPHAPTPSHSHAPALRGTSANLVTQQINNSGLLLLNRGQKSWNRKARTTRVKPLTKLIERICFAAVIR